MKNPKKILTVDECSARGFCSEGCIVDFFSPMITELEEQDKILRTNLKLPQVEKCFKYRQDRSLMKQVIEGPQEVWLDQSELGEKFYTHISQFERDGAAFWVIMITLHLDADPSFVLMQTFTSNEKIVDFYRQRQLLGSTSHQSDPSDTELEEDSHITLSQQTLSSIDQKKSQFLAEIIEKKQDSDIPVEDGHKFEPFIEKTLDDPDEIYHFEDEADDVIYSYIKAIEVEQQSLYYVVLAIKVDADEIGMEQEMIVPVAGFPTNDSQIVHYYRQGNQVMGPVRN